MAPPQYLKIADDLREQIESRALASGDRLPTEQDLRDQYSASRNTVRDAINKLISRGLVETRPGQGTFVVKKMEPYVTTLTGSPKVPTLYGEIDDSAAGKTQGRERVFYSTDPQVEIQKAPANVARLLNIAEGSQVISRHEQRFIDGTPWSMQTTFYPKSYLRRELSGSFTLLGGITGDTLLLSPDRSDDNFLQLGARNTFTYSHELSHQTLCGESDRYRQVIVQTAMQLLMSFAKEVADQQAAALKSILIILYTLAYRIGVGICSIFLFAAVAKNIVRTLMAHRNSREPAYLPISRLPLYQSLAGVALAH